MKAENQHAQRLEIDAEPLLRTSELSVFSREGRPLLKALNMSIGNEGVAIIGRNGAGKSTLLKILAGKEQAAAGTLVCTASTALVQQEGNASVVAIDELAKSEDWAAIGLPSPESLAPLGQRSRGEQRKLALLAAKHSHVQLLLLDEPSQDLDQIGVAWLVEWIRDWRGGLLLVSHDALLLREFENFFLFAESGCRYFPGSYAQLEVELERDAIEGQRRYLRQLNRLERKEQHNATVRRRRLRKKNGGRVREIDRAPSRAMLNSKRSYAQESQGKRAKVQKARMDSSRAWAKAARRALAVQLPLASMLPMLPDDDGAHNLELESVSVVRGQRTLVRELSLSLGRQRIAVTGGNGAGKSSLLQVMLGTLAADEGRVVRRGQRIASIAQGGSDWMLDQSLLSYMLQSYEHSPESLAHRIVAHKFPLALAERPLKSLSPGERVRAALLCIMERRPVVEMLILDEPTLNLDFVGATALRALLGAWPGGLVVASHDRDFLRTIGIQGELALNGSGQVG